MAITDRKGKIFAATGYMPRSLVDELLEQDDKGKARAERIAKLRKTLGSVRPPSERNLEVQTARHRLRLAFLLREGRRSTFHTGPRGLLSTPGNIIRRQSLLGRG